MFGATLMAFLFLSNTKLFRNSISETTSYAIKENSILGTTKINTSRTSTDCDPALWNYIYHSNRFKVYEACKTVSGIILARHYEADGDIHLQLRLNGNSSLLNSKNISGQNSCLVLEIICAKKVTQANAIEPCSGYYNNVTIPSIGDQVSVTGSYVLDTHHGWNEIHPISSLSIISKGDPNAYDKNPIVGKTATGIPIHRGPKGGLYHYSKSGNKVYEKK